MEVYYICLDIDQIDLNNLYLDFGAKHINKKLVNFSTIQYVFDNKLLKTHEVFKHLSILFKLFPKNEFITNLILDDYYKNLYIKYINYIYIPDTKRFKYIFHILFLSKIYKVNITKYLIQAEGNGYNHYVRNILLDDEYIIDFDIHLLNKYLRYSHIVKLIYDKMPDKCLDLINLDRISIYSLIYLIKNTNINHDIINDALENINNLNFKIIIELSKINYNFPVNKYGYELYNTELSEYIKLRIDVNIANIQFNIIDRDILSDLKIAISINKNIILSNYFKLHIVFEGITEFYPYIQYLSNFKCKNIDILENLIYYALNKDILSYPFDMENLIPKEGMEYEPNILNRIKYLYLLLKNKYHIYNDEKYIKLFF